jgi:hypothetical protein
LPHQVRGLPFLKIAYFHALNLTIGGFIGVIIVQHGVFITGVELMGNLKMEANHG